MNELLDKQRKNGRTCCVTYTEDGKVGTINYPGKVNIPYEKFENIDIAFDLVYNPCETEFLKTFKELGKQIINGYIMLQNQALKSYKIWKLLKNKSI